MPLHQYNTHLPIRKSIYPIISTAHVPLGDSCSVEWDMLLGEQGSTLSKFYREHSTVKFWSATFYKNGKDSDRPFTTAGA